MKRFYILPQQAEAACIRAAKQRIQAEEGITRHSPAPSEDSCLIHGFEHMYTQFGDVVAHCMECEREKAELSKTPSADLVGSLSTSSLNPSSLNQSDQS